MQEMQFPNILAFVEGQMERLFLNNNFEYVHVVSIENGCGWSIDRMCENIITLYNSLNSNPDVIVVWYDRERRTESCEAIVKLIYDLLDKGGLPSERLRIGIPDIMTENWILSDEVLIHDTFGYADYKYEHEGRSGSVELNRLFRDAKGRKYKKTKDGSFLLKKMRLKRCVSKSASDFFTQFEFNCW